MQHTAPQTRTDGPRIDPTARVDPAAIIGAGAEIGPFCRIGAGVEIGEDVRLMSHVTVEGPAVIGARTVVHPFAALGGAPQSTGYRGEATRLQIGEECQIREHVTIHRGTVAGGGLTQVGARVFIMSQVHIGHDCMIGDGVIMAGHSALGGHTVVEDHAIIGAMAGVHQFCRIGYRAMVGGMAAVTMDVIPFGTCEGNRARLGGLNIVGLKRSGASRAAIHALRAAYHDLFVADAGPFRDRIDPVAAAHADSAEVARVIAFIRSDRRRPVMPSRRGAALAED